MTKISFACDRCHRPIEGLFTGSFTAGFYVVSEGRAFSKYGRNGENLVCDSCVQSDPLYQADYGGNTLRPSTSCGQGH